MQVGKYQLIHKLATGGMAEVFLAKAAGPRGFEKLLVLKRILPHLASEASFVEMFLSEARLAAQLNHPNIVQIFDFGEADGTYFLAMEYIDGLNLREIIRRASGLGLALPIALCARVIAAACEGLAFAHNFWDLTTGQELNIVHRDISPDNILLSRQGAVKVVDFGIAKAAGLSPHTQTGVLKGKLSYMPPEYLRNEVLDGRVDVYSLGVVFYELISGQRPFTAKSEAGMVQAILYEPPVPIGERRQDVPPAVQRILSKALAKERENRYPDCAAFQEELEEFILSTAKPMGAPQLAQFVSMMMAGEGPGLFPQAPGASRASGRYVPIQSQPPPAAAEGASEAPFAPPMSQRVLPPTEERSEGLEPTSVDRPLRLTGRFPQAEPPRPAGQPAPFAEHPVEPVPLERLREPAPPERLPKPVRSPESAPPARKAPAWRAGVAVVLFLMGGGYLLQRSSSGGNVKPVPPPATTARVSTQLPVSHPEASGAGLGGNPIPSSPRTEPAPAVPGTASNVPRDGDSRSKGGTPTSRTPPVATRARISDQPKAEAFPETFEEEEEPGSLVLEVEPSDTVFNVLVGQWPGRPFQAGRTPLPRREMSPGAYNLELVNEQQETVATRRFRVTAGEVTLIRINLAEE